jgi:hypothetical protein
MMTDGRVIAVLVGVEKLGVDPASLEGRYVSAEGTLLDGVSTRMAGPEVQVTRITIVPAP